MQSMEVEHKEINYKKLTDAATPSRPVTYHYLTPDSSRPSRLIKRANGRTLIKYKNIPVKGWFGFIRDGFTTVINAQWYFVILVFTTMYCLSWLLFAFLWWGIDASYQSLRNASCVSHINDFPSSFLFSLETQVTIGYGYRFISEDCGLGIALLIVQCIVGLLIDSLLLGLVFSKLTRPRNRRKTIFFSDHAVIYEKEGKKYFEFRIVDTRRSQLVEAHVRVQMHWYKEDIEGVRALHQEDLDVGYDTGRDRVFLLAPVSVIHHIKESSPLYTLTVDNCLNQDLELVIILEAIVESTGLTAQALWSYTEEEIRIGYQFQPMMYRHTRMNSWEVDFNLINSITPVSQHEV